MTDTFALRRKRAKYVNESWWALSPRSKRLRVVWDRRGYEQRYELVKYERPKLRQLTNLAPVGEKDSAWTITDRVKLSRDVPDIPESCREGRWQRGRRLGGKRDDRHPRP